MYLLFFLYESRGKKRHVHSDVSSPFLVREQGGGEHVHFDVSPLFFVREQAMREQEEERQQSRRAPEDYDIKPALAGAGTGFVTGLLLIGAIWRRRCLAASASYPKIELRRGAGF